MFRKIISNLSFSPALVGQLSFYAKRLRKEQATRRIGLVFVALALVVQSLTVFQPAESANASNSSDFVPGGLGLGANKSLNNFLNPYDANSNNLKDIMTYVGVTREEITSSRFSSFITGTKLVWGRVDKPGSQAVTIKNSAGAVVTTAYARPLSIANGSNEQIYGWIGNSSKIGWFAIMQSCGNLVTNIVPPPPPPPPPPPQKCVYNSALLATDKKCKPCVGDSSLWINDKKCVGDITLSKSATNTTQGSVNATTITAKESDLITYSITVKNTGLASESTVLADNLEDILEYANLFDRGGGSFDQQTKVLSWPDITLAPKESQTRTFAVKVLDSIPVTARGSSEPTSYDCVMANVFGNSVSIKIPCAPPKIIENVVSELPKTGPTENLIFGGFILAIAAYFYARSRLVSTEVRLIRRNLNSGTI